MLDPVELGLDASRDRVLIDAALGRYQAHMPGRAHAAARQLDGRRRLAAGRHRKGKDDIKKPLQGVASLPFPSRRGGRSKVKVMLRQD